MHSLLQCHGIEWIDVGEKFGNANRADSIALFIGATINNSGIRLVSLLQ